MAESYVTMEPELLQAIDDWHAFWDAYSRVLLADISRQVEEVICGPTMCARTAARN